jgi:hypothetical protein
MGYLIKKVLPEIITAKVTLTSANLLTPGYIYDIPEYPAVTDYFWRVAYMIGFVREVNTKTVYVGTSQIHIQANLSSLLQFRLNQTIMQFSAASITGSVQNNTNRDTE